MHPNAQLIDGFYKAFAARDHAAMRDCYTPYATFEDAVFRLAGKEVGAMWHMLCEGGRDLTLSYSGVEADDTTGRITVHRDRFSFWRWSSQALGPTGLLLGWTPLVRNKVRATARGRLEKFVATHLESE